MRLTALGLGGVLLLGVGCAGAPGAAGVAPTAPGAGPAVATAQPLERLTIPVSQTTASNAALFVAHDGGIFERNGLEVELVNLGAGQPAQAALVSGEVVVTAASGPVAVNAIAAGANVIVVGVILDTLPFQLIARPEYRSIPELRDTTIGINRLGGLPHFVLRYMMRQGGVDVDRDARVVQMGEQPERMAGLRSGAIQATLLQPPFGTIVEREGFRIVGDSAALGLAYPNGVLTMNRDWLRTRRDSARRVLQSLLDGKRAFKTDRELAIRTMQHWFQIDEAALLEDTYDYFSKILEEQVLPRPEGVQFVIDEVATEHPEARSLRVENVVDSSLAGELR
jgi:ABC-type nitrate/sulfonate/bicarbonate transport system substrate-binding protein